MSVCMYRYVSTHMCACVYVYPYIHPIWMTPVAGVSLSSSWLPAGQQHIPYPLGLPLFNNVGWFDGGQGQRDGSKACPPSPGGLQAGSALEFLAWDHPAMGSCVRVSPGRTSTPFQARPSASRLAPCPHCFGHCTSSCRGGVVRCGAGRVVPLSTVCPGEGGTERGVADPGRDGCRRRCCATCCLLFGLQGGFVVLLRTL